MSVVFIVYGGYTNNIIETVFFNFSEKLFFSVIAMVQIYIINNINMIGHVKLRNENILSRFFDKKHDLFFGFLMFGNVNVLIEHGLYVFLSKIFFGDIIHIIH